MHSPKWMSVVVALFLEAQSLNLVPPMQIAPSSDQKLRVSIASMKVGRDVTLIPSCGANLRSFGAYLHFQGDMNEATQNAWLWVSFIGWPLPMIISAVVYFGVSYDLGMRCVFPSLSSASLSTKPWFKSKAWCESDESYF